MSDSDLRKAAQDISAYFAGNPYGLVSAHLMERLRAALAQPQEDHSPDAGKMVSSQQDQAAPTVETGLVVMRDKVSRRWYVYSPEHKGVCTLFRVVSGPFGDQSAANAALAGLMKAAQPQAETTAEAGVFAAKAIAEAILVEASSAAHPDAEVWVRECIRRIDGLMSGPAIKPKECA